MKPRQSAASAWHADFLVNAIALVVAGLGLLVLTGWFFHIEVLVRLSRHGITMRFNTAICFLITALGLWCGLRVQANRYAHIARLCGMTLATVGLLILLERLFDWNFHIDQLLWTDTISISKPGEMSGITAACFLLIGLCLWLRASRRSPLPAISQWLVLAAALVAQWAVLDALLRTNEGTGVAIHTAFALQAVCFALLICPGEGGILDVLSRVSSGGRILRRLLPVAMLVPLLLGCFRWYLVQQQWIGMQAGLSILVTVVTASVLLTTIWSANSIDRIERQRQQLEEELTGFFNLPLHSLLAIIGFDGRFRRISSSWSQILGYDQERILNTPYLDLVDPADQEATRLCAARIAGGEPAVEFENRYVAKDGKTRWLMWNAIPAGNELMYTIAEDITERKAAGNDLRQSEERLRLLIEGLKGHAVYMLDPQGRIMSWNSGAQQLTGYSAPEVIGQPVSMLYPATNRERMMCDVLAQAAATGHVEQQALKLRKDGSRFLVEMHIAALRDEEGKLLGFAKISRDITDRARAEQEIRELNEHLERKVDERTAELAASNKELEAFAYSVSHDLRAPLRHLDGFLSLLQKRAYHQMDEQARHYIDCTITASRRMGTLIDELLQFSRLGRSQLRKTQVDLAEVVDRTREELGPESDNRVVHWNIAALPGMVADPSMLRQVMQNLLGNALKFTRSRAEAEISVGTRNEPDGAITVWVRDNGVGFDMQYYGKLFQVFQRLHGESEFEGTGIGLANVRRMVERHGGQVWAEGDLGKGATFYFSLPQMHGQALEEEDDEPIEANSAGGR